MKRLLLFLVIACFMAVPCASADTVTATVTADNYYVLAYGNADGSVLTTVGSSLTVDWNTPETYTFDAAETDYIYAAVWGDGQIAQGFLGQFVTAGGTIVTHPAMWEYCSTRKPFAETSFAADIAAAEWSPIAYSVGQGAGTWPVLADISLDALWIWPTPLSPGSSLGEYHLLRTKAVYAPLPDITPDAGPNISITMDELESTVIHGQVAYTGDDPLQYRWIMGSMVLLDWTAVGAANECPLPYNGQPLLGSYTLTLQVTDGTFTFSDSMTLTVTVPTIIAADAGEDLSVPINELPTTVIQGQALYLGTDPLTYRWVLGSYILLDWTAVEENNACPLTYNGTPIPVGSYTLTLEVTDGAVSASDTMILEITEPLPLVADAGEDITVSISNELMVINGTATYTGSNPLAFRWLYDGNVIIDWAPVGADNACPLPFVPATLPLGSYELTLEVTDGEYTDSDAMILTIEEAVISLEADAGENISVYSDNVTGTALGTAVYTGDEPLFYRWLIEGVALLDWTPVISGNQCPYTVDHGSIPVGQYTLTLEVTDGVISAADNAILTVMNSAPHAAVLVGPGTYPLGSNVVLGSEASDFDGDILAYEWRKGSVVLASGSVQAIAGGDPVSIPNCVVSGLGLGTHAFTLEVADEINAPVVISVNVAVIDSEAPTLAPVASNGILWPPNHQMVDITIQANAADNSGLPVTLSVEIASNEPEDGLGDGDLFPDWGSLSIDDDTGVITVLLRSERSGTGDGREYTLTITATDSSGNASSVDKVIIVPHDKSKK